MIGIFPSGFPVWHSRTRLFDTDDTKAVVKRCVDFY